MLLAVIFRQPALVRLMLGMALVALPVIAWIDYQKGYHFSAAVELTAAVALVVLIGLIKPLGARRAATWTLLAMFVFSVLGSFEKLGSTANFAWFTVMPFLYIAVGGLRLGGLLTVAHLLIIAVCYLTFARPVLAALDTGSAIHVALAYLTAAGLAFSYEQMQRQLRSRLRALADHDALTGLLNRRGMEKRLTELADFLTRHDVVVTLALLDVDHFKRVNDLHGHDIGDKVLVEIGQELQQALRGSDYLARWGGEEFLVALTHTGIDDSAAVLERLRVAIAGGEHFCVPSITLSAGAAEWHAGTPLNVALKAADLALYEAKQSGRNRLVSASTGDKLLAYPGGWPSVQSS